VKYCLPSREFCQFVSSDSSLCIFLRNHPKQYSCIHQIQECFLLSANQCFRTTKLESCNPASNTQKLESVEIGQYRIHSKCNTYNWLGHHLLFLVHLDGWFVGVASACIFLNENLLKRLNWFDCALLSLLLCLKDGEGIADESLWTNKGNMDN